MDYNKYIFLDYEDIQDINFNIINKKVKIIVIIGKNEITMPVDLLNMTQSLGNSIEWINIENIENKDALYSFIINKLGYYTFKQGYKEFIIYSKNKDFDPIIEYYQDKKINLKRIENIRQINETTKENFIKKMFKYISFLWSKFTLTQKIFFIGIIITVIASLISLHILTLTLVSNSQNKDKTTMDQNGIVLNDFAGMPEPDIKIIDRDQKLIQQFEAKYRADILRQLQAIYGSDRIRDLFIEIETDMPKKAIEKIIVSVNIDGKWEFKYDKKNKFIISPDGSRKREYIPISDKEWMNVVMLIQHTIGYNPNRSDSVIVQNIPFDRSKQFADEDVVYFRRQKIGTILFFLFGLIIICIIIRIIFSIKNNKKRRLNQSGRLL